MILDLHSHFDIYHLDFVTMSTEKDYNFSFKYNKKISNWPLRLPHQSFPKAS